jgi:CRISPR-associated protein Cas8a1/Csx13
VQGKALEAFDLALRCLPNRIIIKTQQSKKADSNSKSRFFISTSLARGLIGDNIASAREWFRGFALLLGSKELARIVRYERGGLKQMVEQAHWTNEADKRLVEAVHAAIRNRYGALAAQAKARGENIRFDREFERMRTGLMRAKNAQTLRAELADLFARGGLNRTLQKDWKEILPLFSGSDWQRARDLALLGLASYTGKGADEIETVYSESGEEEQP